MVLIVNKGIHPLVKPTERHDYNGLKPVVEIYDTKLWTHPAEPTARCQVIKSVTLPKKGDELTVIQTSDIVRPPKELIEGLRNIGSATASGELAGLGIRDSQIRGPIGWTPNVTMVGPALTLQFMPKREDQYGEGEYNDPEMQLHRHVLYHTQPGDIVVVDARGDMASGVFGEMMLTYFKGRGGQGIVVDGCIRDYPTAKELGLGIWIKGVTPNYHTQTGIFPFAVNVPIACGERLVMPGDLIIADEDGVVVVPIKLAPQLLKRANEHREWEEFSKMMLEKGGDLRKYYPLREDAWKEYEVWKAKQDKKAKPKQKAKAKKK